MNLANEKNLVLVSESEDQTMDYGLFTDTRVITMKLLQDDLEEVSGGT